MLAVNLPWSGAGGDLTPTRSLNSFSLFLFLFFVGDDAYGSSGQCISFSFIDAGNSLTQLHPLCRH